MNDKQTEVYDYLEGNNPLYMEFFSKGIPVLNRTGEIYTAYAAGLAKTPKYQKINTAYIERLGNLGVRYIMLNDFVIDMRDYFGLTTEKEIPISASLVFWYGFERNMHDFAYLDKIWDMDVYIPMTQLEGRGEGVFPVAGPGDDGKLYIPIYTDEYLCADNFVFHNELLESVAPGKLKTISSCSLKTLWETSCLPNETGILINYETADLAIPYVKS